jgi:hypothetical protein
MWFTTITELRPRAARFLRKLLADVLRWPDFEYGFIEGVLLGCGFQLLEAEHATS